MDLRLFGQVIARHKVLVACAAVLACLVGFFSYAKVDRNGFSYRSSQEWASSSRVLVTQPGSSFLRTAATSGNSKQLEALFSDEGRFSALSQVFATIAMSDAVRSAALDGNKGKIDAHPVVNNQTDQVLPVVEVTGVASTPRSSQVVADRTVAALLSYVKRQQVAAEIAPRERIDFVVLNKAARTKAKLLTPRSKTVPVIAFMALLLAGVGLAFYRENVDPRALERRRRMTVVEGRTVEEPPLAEASVTDADTPDVIRPRRATLGQP